MSRLQADHITLGYAATEIVTDLSVTIPDGKITTIIGPNGCGKSTLLRSLVRLLKPRAGTILLDGQAIHSLPTREIAQRLGLLAQGNTPPGGLIVEDLVMRGRYPHQGFLQPPSKQDTAAVDHALHLAGMTALRQRPLESLSGGQRQRAWIAMVLAQETPILLLDEPTTYLDVAHQLEVTDLVQRLNREQGRTIVMVLHDVNEAARTSDHIVAMKHGAIVRQGPPDAVIEPELLFELYGVTCDVYCAATTAETYCVPRSETVSMNGSRPPSTCPGFSVDRVKIGYDDFVVVDDLSTELHGGDITVIVGPNACGKSTLLRTCARLLHPKQGTVRLGADEVHRGSHRKLARQMALLAQGSVAPPDFAVEDLVALGRVPHQSFLRRWRKEDEQAIDAAIDRTALADLRYRDVLTLSGGQRQRAWVGLALAQDTPVLLLDEPTTFLDLSSQIALLDLARTLNQADGRSIVMILHDLNLAARYADRIIAMKDGAIVAAGTPTEVVTKELLRTVFDVEAEIVIDPRTGAPVVLPRRVVTDKPVDPELPDEALTPTPITADEMERLTVA